LLELLKFFVLTHLSGIPVVEDNADGGVLGYLSRRDLLQFLDICYHSAARRVESSSARGDEGDDDDIAFDVTAPVGGVLNTLRRFRPTEDAQGGGVGSSAGSTPKTKGNEAGSNVIGASFVYEKELSLKMLLLRILAAENRKVLFVKGDKDSDIAPQLVRMLSVSDVWWLLIGSDVGTSFLTATS
jgi:hypothetical protein